LQHTTDYRTLARAVNSGHSIQQANRAFRFASQPAMWFNKKSSKWNIFHTALCIEGGLTEVNMDRQPVTSQFIAKPLADDKQLTVSLFQRLL
jgi:hypothetical protein